MKYRKLPIFQINFEDTCILVAYLSKYLKLEMKYIGNVKKSFIFLKKVLINDEFTRFGLFHDAYFMMGTIIYTRIIG